MDKRTTADVIEEYEQQAMKMRSALNVSLAAMTIARALPGVSTEYDFDGAIAEVQEALGAH